MAYQIPQRPHMASRWLTATLVGIYAVIIALVLLLSTDSNGNTDSGKRSGFSASGVSKSTAKTVSAYSN